MANQQVKDATGANIYVKGGGAGSSGDPFIPEHYTQRGAANVAVSQAPQSTAAATLVAARPTRRRVTVKNMDAAITVYIGPATVAAANGMELKAGESITLTWVGLIQCIAASGTPNVSAWDEYD